jgi:hypothetical protein
MPLDQVSVALCPGSTALGLKEMLMYAGSAGVVVDETPDPPAHPKRTSNDRKRKTKTEERDRTVPVGTCISPPFA